MSEVIQAMPQEGGVEAEATETGFTQGWPTLMWPGPLSGGHSCHSRHLPDPQPLKVGASILPYQN